MKMFRRILTGAAVVIAVAGIVSADTITYNSETTPPVSTVPDTTTNFSFHILFPLFDSAMGTLNSVSITLFGDVLGTARFESLDGSPATVTTDLRATLTLTRPDTSTIVVTVPDFNTITNVTAFDGIIDF